MFCLLGGGGVKGSQIVGSTDAKGEVPLERAVTPSDIHATSDGSSKGIPQACPAVYSASR